MMSYLYIRPIAINRLRGTERGAALFVVVMVITLLTAVGIFAARSTSLVDAATGYGRQAAQTLALADYGAKLVASELERPSEPCISVDGPTRPILPDLRHSVEPALLCL